MKTIVRYSRLPVALFFCLLGAVHLSVEAQMLNTPFELSDQIVLSPTERQYREICVQTKEKRGADLFPLSDKLRDSAYVRFGSAYGDIAGDYLPYNGNNYSSLSLESGGRISVRNYGTLQGSASYSLDRKSVV